MMKRLTAHEILLAIKREDSSILKEIYKTYYPSISYFIISNSGAESDARDIFQDAMVIIFLKVRDNFPKLTSTFGTYLFSISKFLWLKELSRRTPKESVEVEELSDLENDFLQDYVFMEKRKLILEHFMELNTECRKLLSLFLNGYSIAEVTAELDYHSEAHTRAMKSRCKERLVKRIWKSPRYKELRNEVHRENSKVPRW